MKRLTRSSSDRHFLGVCGGLGEYFNIDSTIIRLIFLVTLFSGGISLVPYFLMAFIIPYDYQVKRKSFYQEESKPGFSKTSRVIKDITPEDEDNWSDF